MRLIYGIALTIHVTFIQNKQPKSDKAMKKSTFIITVVLLLSAAFLTAQSSYDAMKDYDGNTYKTMQIGSQCWTKENTCCQTSICTGTTILE